MKKNTRYVGLDVHAATISVAVAEGDAKPRSLGTIPNRLESIRKLVRKLGPKKSLKVCYEAGPCGYALYWQLTELGVTCEVIAPTLVPTKAGDRVKNDPKDARKLAECYRAGMLTPVWVPDKAHEALRDLVRARLAAKRDQTRARHRLSKFFLRLGLKPPAGVRAWSTKYNAWASKLSFEHFAQQETYLDYIHEVEHANERIKRLERAIDQAIEEAPEGLRAVIEGLQALRGVAKVTAVTIVAELGDITRFAKPRELMSYAGVTPSEYSSGSKTSRGGITKTGNSHLRRVVVEAAWNYRYQPRLTYKIKKRQEHLRQDVREIGWKAQVRLHSRYVRMVGRGKTKQQTVTAVGRELLGFVWAIAMCVQNGKPLAKRAA